MFGSSNMGDKLLRGYRPDIRDKGKADPVSDIRHYLPLSDLFAFNLRAFSLMNPSASF